MKSSHHAPSDGRTLWDMSDRRDPPHWGGWQADRNPVAERRADRLRVPARYWLIGLPVLAAATVLLYIATR